MKEMRASLNNVIPLSACVQSKSDLLCHRHRKNRLTNGLKGGEGRGRRMGRNDGRERARCEIGFVTTRGVVRRKNRVRMVPTRNP